MMQHDASAHLSAGDDLALLAELFAHGRWQLDDDGAGVVLDEQAQRLLGCPNPGRQRRVTWGQLPAGSAPWQQAAQRALGEGGRLRVPLPSPASGDVGPGLQVLGLRRTIDGRHAVLGVVMPAAWPLPEPAQEKTRDAPPAQHEPTDAAATVADLLEVERRDALARLNRELRVPLNAMLGFAQLLDAASAERAEPVLRGHARAILSSGRQMLDMIDELLVLRDAHVGGREVMLMPLDVQATLLQWMLPEATFAAERSVGAVIHAWADPVLMRRLITIAGGREIARERGTGAGAFVTFDGTSEPGAVRLRFVHRYRDLRSPDQRSPLRVELVRRLAEAMGGELGIQEDDDSVAFEVRLRRAHLEATPSAQPRTDRPGMAGEARLRSASEAVTPTGNVLCVEDDPGTLLLMQHALSAYPGLRVRTASTAAEALASVVDCMPDLVLLDLVLPGAGGEEVMHQLRRRAGGRHRPACVVLSSIVEPEVRERLLATGADDYLTKPIQLSQLDQTLRRLLVPASPVRHRA